MAFDAHIIVIKKKYQHELNTIVLSESHTLLTQYMIAIEREVTMKEYEEMTSSKEINRYIRIKKNIFKKQQEDAYELVKVGTTRYQAFEKFASATYAFFSISGLADDIHTVIWFSFHARLYRAFTEFKDFSFNLARRLSVRLGRETFVLSASSFSRNADKFIMYLNGRERNKLSSKGALTEVRQLYGLDINTLMVTVDKNMGIHYASMDYQAIVQEITEQKKRYRDWQVRRDELKKNEHGKMIENKDDGSEYMDTFERENEYIMCSLMERLALIEKALHTDPIGTVIYFKMTDRGPQMRGIPVNEREFGRNC